MVQKKELWADFSELLGYYGDVADVDFSA